jgi:hypothetical protein
MRLERRFKMNDAQIIILVVGLLMFLIVIISIFLFNKFAYYDQKIKNLHVEVDQLRNVLSIDQRTISLKRTQEILQKGERNEKGVV